MDQEYFDNSSRQFLQSLGSLSERRILVRCDHFQALATSVLPEDFAKVVGFSATQIGLWDAEWLFSQASTPDADAAGERDGWVAIWTAAAETLMRAVPVSSAALKRKKDDACLRIVAEKSLETNGGTLTARLAIKALFPVRLLLLRLGLATVAHRCCRRTLFPLNAVGRAEYGNRGWDSHPHVP
jgi:hypothetical protein